MASQLTQQDLTDALETLEQLEIDEISAMTSDEIEVCLNWLTTYGPIVEELLKKVLKRA